MNLRRFLGIYYAYAFLFDFVFAYAIYTALFELEGLSTTQIGTLLAFWSLSAIVLEVPSGALSDHFDRRLLLILAPLAKALTFVCWGLAGGNFWLYGLGFFFWSLGQAWQSGSREALLYERMAHAGRADDFDKVLGRDNAAEGLGIGAGTLLGGFVGWLSFDWAIWLSIPPLLLAAVLAVWLKDVRRVGSAEAAEEPPAGGYLSHFRDAVAEFRRHADLRFVTIYMAGGLVVFELLEEFDQLYYIATAVPVWAWGVLAAGIEGVYALASLHAHRLAGRPWLAWLLPLLGGTLLVIASIGGSPWYVLALSAAYVIVAPVTVLAEARFQRIMEGRSRATTTSSLVMAENVVGVLLTLLFGVLADRLGILPAYGWAGLCMVPFGLWVFYRQRRGVRATD
ncbi:MFS transporter [Devosia sp. PTR5]|uniref:MFS transporter n=1 Tax=Devosia oryzisoli TaxID=2774138 RepID=A0A927FR62_9HYPH|nr:MFS transporter [Devosia oryzisoli]MBD8064730.1 MFS transporter [Devosia oryzisoli]